MILDKDKKKIIVSVVGTAILIMLVVGVFYALTFIKNGLQTAIGDPDGSGDNKVQFNFKQADELGIVVQQ